VEKVLKLELLEVVVVELAVEVLIPLELEILQVHLHHKEILVELLIEGPLEATHVKLMAEVAAVLVLLGVPEHQVLVVLEELE
tara:strand:+ start:154 stop:402 length:249 start_codon:yes stop_codon:yes gene_type:complete